MLVDDHVLFREGVAGLMNAQLDFQVVGEAGTVKEAIALAKTTRPDTILMDYSLPDGTGLDATQAILSVLPDVNIVFLTMHEENENLFAAIRAGAKGYLPKNVPVSRLLAYLRGVELGEAALTPLMASRILNEFSRMQHHPHSPAGNHTDHADLEGLTTREVEVLRELATGATNREIADRLVITENTVKNHVRNILAKLHLKNRREAALFARQRKL
jgi:two-component system NarL family response regulator